MDFTDADVESLADKLAAMELTDGEWEALRTMAAVSAETMSGDDEVGGFVYIQEIPSGARAVFGSVTLKLGPPTGSYQALPELDANIRNVKAGGGSPGI